MAEPNASHLSIGEVLGLLLEEFPDITISKIRFLESQGLIEPERTPSGYRKFYEHDVELLRVILREQREHFLPLRVIKDRIDAGVIEAAGTPPHGTRRHRSGRSPRRAPRPSPIIRRPVATAGRAASAPPPASAPMAPSAPHRRRTPSLVRPPTRRRGCFPASSSAATSCARWRRSPSPSSPRSRSTG